MKITQEASGCEMGSELENWTPTLILVGFRPVCETFRPVCDEPGSLWALDLCVTRLFLSRNVWGPILTAKMAGKNDLFCLGRLSKFQGQIKLSAEEWIWIEAWQHILL